MQAFKKAVKYQINKHFYKLKDSKKIKKTQNFNIKFNFYFIYTVIQTFYFFFCQFLAFFKFYLSC